ncbi:DUF397 domain-containing protein [Cryptosporangium sp. NPDC048952]|uniref:DUF397 domain-containing protein n=1 Tax=Cryptosporangium sp. NPDC048952 TaxID=3363961 RepID=UPI0037143B81
MSDGRLAWVKSSACAHSNCIEVACSGDQVLMRGGVSKIRLAFTRPQWRAFIADLQQDSFKVGGGEQAVPDGPKRDVRRPL